MSRWRWHGRCLSPLQCPECQNLTEIDLKHVHTTCSLRTTRPCWMRRKWIPPNIARIQCLAFLPEVGLCVCAVAVNCNDRGRIFAYNLRKQFFVPFNYSPIQYWVNFWYTNANICKTTTSCLLTNFFKSHYVMINKCIETFSHIIYNMM